MEFKLSAREVAILEDRDKILGELRRGRRNRRARAAARRPTRPPVLVVPADGSGLMQVIERDRSYSEDRGEVNRGEEGGGTRAEKRNAKWWQELKEQEQGVRQE